VRSAATSESRVALCAAAGQCCEIREPRVSVCRRPRMTNGPSAFAQAFECDADRLAVGAPQGIDEKVGGATRAEGKLPTASGQRMRTSRSPGMIDTSTSIADERGPARRRRGVGGGGTMRARRSGCIG